MQRSCGLSMLGMLMEQLREVLYLEESGGRKRDRDRSKRGVGRSRRARQEDQVLTFTVKG